MRYYEKCTYALANKSFRGLENIQENYKHLGEETGLLKLSKMGRRMWQEDLKGYEGQMEEQQVAL